MKSGEQSRPLSPHLQVYRWQLTMSLSILHRMTGVFLSTGALLLVYWLVVLAWYPQALPAMQSLLFSIPGQLVLLAIAYSFSFHFLNGIRHLFWDIGMGFEIASFNRSGWAVVFFSVVMTLGGWYLVIGGAL